MPGDRPTVIVLGGVNGAGKTTSSKRLLADRLGVPSFTNADEIARGLSGFAPESEAIAAGRIMLQRLNELARERTDFAFETTLAGRSYVAFLRELRACGYAIELYYFWLSSAEPRSTASVFGSGEAATTSRRTQFAVGMGGASRTSGPPTDERQIRGSCMTTVGRSRT